MGFFWASIGLAVCVTKTCHTKATLNMYLDKMNLINNRSQMLPFRQEVFSSSWRPYDQFDRFTDVRRYLDILSAPNHQYRRCTHDVICLHGAFPDKVATVADQTSTTPSEK